MLVVEGVTSRLWGRDMPVAEKHHPRRAIRHDPSIFRKPCPTKPLQPRNTQQGSRT